MPVSFVGSSRGTTSATLPPGTATNDIVVVFAYATTATTPTLPASWTNIGSNAVTPALRVQYRVYDGVWTMPTITGAVECHALTFRGQHATTPIGVTSVTNATNITVTWPAVTLQDSSSNGALIRGVVNARPDVALPASTGHTIQQTGGAVGSNYYMTQTLNSVTSGSAATSAAARSSAWTQGTVEILSTPVIPAQRPIRAVRQAVNRAGMY